MIGAKQAKKGSTNVRTVIRESLDQDWTEIAVRRLDGPGLSLQALGDCRLTSK
jgi:hypothetical protein